MNRNLKLAAAASFLLNLALAGVLICHHAPFDANAAIARLPEAKQKLLHDTFQALVADQAGERATLDTVRADELRILTAQSFDPKAYIAAANRASQINSALSLRMQETVAKVAAHYTPEERKVLADIFRHRWQNSLLNSLAGQDGKAKQ